MFIKLDKSFKVFGIMMFAILTCLALLPIMSSYQANIALEALEEISTKERAYNATLSMLKDAETGQRGFLLGNDESFLIPFNSGVGDIPMALKELSKLASSPEDREVVRKIDLFAKAKIVEMNKTIALKRAGESQEASDMVASQRGKSMMDQLRLLFKGQLQRLEQQRIGLHSELTAALQYNMALGLGASLASFAMICASIFVAANSLNQRAEAAKQAELLAETNATHANISLLRAKHVSATAQMLQAIDSVSNQIELPHVLPVFLSKLLPGTSGEVYLYRNSRDFLELKAHWGDGQARVEILSPSDCWGLRLGKIHRAATVKDLCCAHSQVNQSLEHVQICVPMISQGEVIGLLTVAGLSANDEVIEHDTIIALAEQLGLAISNVTLREKLRQQSTVDPLTGLYNRRHFDESLKRELVRAQRTKTSCSIVMIDLDHFKRINDTYGHDAGDLVLKEASKRLLARTRASDLVCRYGGEELVLLLPDCTAESAVQCAEAIRQSIAEISIHHLSDHITGITASFGIAACPTHAQQGGELLKAADRALYSAKNTGRNRVVIAETSGDKIVDNYRA